MVWPENASDIDPTRNPDAQDEILRAVDALGTPLVVGTLLEQRQAARANKDFTTADAIRDRIKAAGIEVEDTPSGPSWSLS